ncbi:MAG: TIGR04002 family protein [Lachnospiraceae bacterium]|nr:TIGR04002 family protein [Lachnospiraceae bacterium]
MKSLKKMTVTGVFTALIFVFTAFIHVPSYTGYVHLGDSFIFLAASMLPLPYALFAGAAGAVLSDVLTGFAVWAPASLIIKCATVLFFTWKKPTFLTKRNMLALIPAAVLCVGGYYIYEVILYGNFVTPAYGAFGNLFQAVFSSAVYLLVGLTLDKMKGKQWKLSLIQ